jgi:hypothetical protein
MVAPGKYISLLGQIVIEGENTLKVSPQAITLTSSDINDLHLGDYYQFAEFTLIKTMNLLPI